MPEKPLAAGSARPEGTILTASERRAGMRDRPAPRDRPRKGDPAEAAAPDPGDGPDRRARGEDGGGPDPRARRSRPARTKGRGPVADAEPWPSVSIRGSARRIRSCARPREAGRGRRGPRMRAGAPLFRQAGSDRSEVPLLHGLGRNVGRKVRRDTGGARPLRKADRSARAADRCGEALASSTLTRGQARHGRGRRRRGRSTARMTGRAAFARHRGLGNSPAARPAERRPPPRRLGRGGPPKRLAIGLAVGTARSSGRAQAIGRQAAIGRGISLRGRIRGLSPSAREDEGLARLRLTPIRVVRGRIPQKTGGPLRIARRGVRHPRAARHPDFPEPLTVVAVIGVAAKPAPGAPGPRGTSRAGPAPGCTRPCRPAAGRRRHGGKHRNLLAHLDGRAAAEAAAGGNPSRRPPPRACAVGLGAGIVPGPGELPDGMAPRGGTPRAPGRPGRASGPARRRGIVRAPPDSGGRPFRSARRGGHRRVVAEGDGGGLPEGPAVRRRLRPQPARSPSRGRPGPGPRTRLPPSAPGRTRGSRP